MSRPLGYLIGRYPAASHAFLAREIEALRDRGLEIETITIRPARSEELLTEADREAAESTYRVLPSGPLKLLGSHLAAVFSHPGRYFKTLGYALGLGRGARGKLWQLFYFVEAMVVWRRWWGTGIDHIVTHFADTGTESALLAAHFEPQWSFSLTVHGPDEFAEAETNRLAEKLRRARTVIAVSDDARRLAIEVGGEEVAAKAHVVRLGVDLDRFTPARRQPRSPLRVFSLGRLVERKDQATLLAAIAELPDLQLTLAGEGPEREALEALVAELGIAERVDFAGVVGQDDARRLYEAADLFCLSSRSEGLPAVLIEAMACALPVVATRIDAVPELINDGENGLLVEPGRPEELAAALGRLAADPALRQRLGTAARKTVSKRHDLGRQAAQLAELFGSSD